MDTKMTTDQAKEYLVGYMMENFTDTTFHRYIRGQIGGSGPLAGDFAWQLATALQRQRKVHDQLVSALKLVQMHVGDEITGRIIGRTTLDKIISDAILATDQFSQPLGPTIAELQAAGKLAPTKRFNICNRVSSKDWGTFPGNTGREALDALAVAHGFSNYDIGRNYFNDGDLNITEVR